MLQNMPQASYGTQRGPQNVSKYTYVKKKFKLVKKCPVLAEQLENPSHVCSQMLASWAQPLRLFCHDGIGALGSKIFFCKVTQVAPRH